MASYQFAGQFINALLATPLALLPSQAVTVKLLDGTTNATLYTGRTKTSTATNPVTTDSSGNLNFYADPGQYILSVTVGSATSTTTISVAPDALEDPHPYSTARYGASSSATAAANATAVQAAVAAAAAGDLRRDVWQPGAVLPITSFNFNDAPCALKGASSFGTIFRADGSADVITASHTIERTGINLEDFAVSNNGSTTKDCIHFGTHVVEVCLTRVEMGSARYGLRITDNSHIYTVTDCTFGSNLVWGFYGEAGTADVSIKGCWFNENTTGGLYLNGPDNAITGNRFSNTAQAVFLDSGASRNSITGNVFGAAATGTAGIRVYGSHNVIVGNYVGNHASLDIQLEASSSNNIVAFNDLGGGSIVDNGTNNFCINATAGQLLALGGTAAKPFYSFNSHTDAGMYPSGANVGLAVAGTEAFVVQLPNSDDDAGVYLLRKQGGVVTLQKVTQGIADSGGAGFKLLRVPN